jgi:hypothetical protein
VLAVGAGWIGREILLERGWTDPFHSGDGAASELRTDAPPIPGLEVEAPVGGSAAEVDRVGGVDGDVGPAEDERRRQAPGDDIPEGQVTTGEVRAQKSDAGSERRKEVAQGPPPALERPAVRGAVSETEANEAEPAESAEGRELRVDGVVPPAEPEARMFIERDVAAPAAADSSTYHHARPVAPRELGVGDPGGCYRLERSFATGVVLPDIIELRPRQVEAPAARLPLAYEVGLPPGFERMKGTWLPFGPDSLWVQVGTGLVGMTLRLERDGVEYAGRGIVARDVAGSAPSGPSRLTPVPCSELGP